MKHYYINRFFIKALYSFFLLLIYNSLIAQVLDPASIKRVDSLGKELIKATHDTTRAKLYLELTEVLYISNIDTMIPLCNKAIKIADKALNKNISPLEKLAFIKAKANALNNIGFVFYQKGKVAECIDYFTRSLDIRKLVNDKAELATSYNNLGTIFLSQGKIQKAIDYFSEGLKLYEQTENKKGIGYAYNNIGAVYDDQGERKKAIEYYYKSLKIREEIGDKQGIAESLANLGVSFDKDGDPDKGIEYFLRASGISKQLNNKQAMAYALKNLAELYSRKGKIDLAIDNYTKALALQKEIGEKEGIALTFHGLAQIYYDQNKLEQAKNLATQSLELGKELGFPETIHLASRLLFQIYYKQNNYKKSLEMYMLAVKMNDSIVNTHNRESTVKQQLKYEYGTKALADSIKNTEEKKVKDAQIFVQHAQLEQEKTKQFILFGGLAMVLLFAGFMFNRFKVTQKQKQIIEQQKHLVEEKQKEILDSIHYAKRIQQSLITSEKYIHKSIKRLNDKTKP